MTTLLDKITGMFGSRGRARAGAPAGGPPGAPGESGPGTRAYDGAVHVGEEGADPPAERRTERPKE